MGPLAVCEGDLGIPPSPCPLKALLGAGSAKRAGKILMSNGLEVKILRTKSLERRCVRFTRRVGLDHHCAAEMAGTRLDVTTPHWKFGPRVGLPLDKTLRSDSAHAGQSVGPTGQRTVDFKFAWLSWVGFR